MADADEQAHFAHVALLVHNLVRHRVSYTMLLDTNTEGLRKEHTWASSPATHPYIQNPEP